MGISERHSKAALLASTTAVLVLAGVLFAAELDAQGNRATSSGAETATLSIPSSGGNEYVVSKSVPLTALWHELFAN